MAALSGQVALVTGASRGVALGLAHAGVALGLAHAGAKVFATGRTVARASLDSDITAIACDHTDDEAVARVFRQIETGAGRLDILVNVAWGGYERMVEDGRFTFGAPFWEQPAWRWDAMMTIGRAVAALASDPRVHERTGQVLVAATLGEEYGFTDIDGKRPRPLTLSDV